MKDCKNCIHHAVCIQLCARGYVAGENCTHYLELKFVEEKKERYWAARDDNGTLCLYRDKPKCYVAEWGGTYIGHLPESWLPDLTWGDEPVEVFGLKLEE